MTIRELRILPPFAIGRLGSASEPARHFTIEDDPDHPLGFSTHQRSADAPLSTRRPAKSSGHARRPRLSSRVSRFDRWQPFLEVFALTDGDTLEPLTLDLHAPP